MHCTCISPAQWACCYIPDAVPDTQRAHRSRPATRQRSCPPTFAWGPLSRGASAAALPPAPCFAALPAVRPNPVLPPLAPRTGPTAPAGGALGHTTLRAQHVTPRHRVTRQASKTSKPSSAQHSVPSAELGAPSTSLCAWVAWLLPLHRLGARSTGLCAWVAWPPPLHRSNRGTFAWRLHQVLTRRCSTPSADRSAPVACASASCTGAAEVRAAVH